MKILLLTLLVRLHQINSETIALTIFYHETLLPINIIKASRILLYGEK